MSEIESKGHTRELFINEAASDLANIRAPQSEPTKQNELQNEPHDEPVRDKLLCHLETENLFLRGLIEQHQRSEDELRASLRAALTGMPKAIEEGRPSEIPNVINEQIEAAASSRSTPTTETTQAALIGAQRIARARELKPWQVVIARVLGIR